MNASYVNAFPLESISRDISRNNYNFEAIFNAIVEWNNSTEDTVTVRLTKDSPPYYNTWTFPTKKSQLITAGTTSVSPVAADSYAYTNEYPIMVTTSSDSAKKDTLVLRINVSNSGGTSWMAFEDVYIFVANASSTDYIKSSIVRNSANELKIVTQQDSVSPKTWDELVTLGYVSDLITDYAVSMTSVLKNHFVIYAGNIYVATEDVTSLNTGMFGTSSLVKVGSVWDSASVYNKGSLVVRALSDYGNYHMFVNLIDDGINRSDPSDYIGSYDGSGNYTEQSDASDRWKEIVAVPISEKFTSSTIVRISPDVDIKGIMLKNSGDSYASLNVNISIDGNVSYKKPESIYNRKVGVISTSNYAMYPVASSPVWTSGKTSAFDDSIPGTERQSYSAGMLFDHAAENVSTINYINYDGPDLDQGLCIYLPVESDTSSGISLPEDGYTFEFFFRIWPNPSLNGKVTNDLIINKAQIYVYSVKNASEAYSGSCLTNPIAKFSMARLTNFYVYDENIGIANRPVMYRATFIYSASSGTWKIFDYYQLPDHVFIGPVGFVDPTNPGNISNSDEPGNAFSGMETAGYPMFSDPFDKVFLTRI